MERNTPIQGEGNTDADRRYRAAAGAFAEDFDPKDEKRLAKMAREAKGHIDELVGDLSNSVDGTVFDARRRTARALHELSARLRDERDQLRRDVADGLDDAGDRIEPS